MMMMNGFKSTFWDNRLSWSLWRPSEIKLSTTLKVAPTIKDCVSIAHQSEEVFFLQWALDASTACYWDLLLAFIYHEQLVDICLSWNRDRISVPTVFWIAHIMKTTELQLETNRYPYAITLLPEYILTSIWLNTVSIQYILISISYTCQPFRVKISEAFFTKSGGLCPPAIWGGGGVWGHAPLEIWNTSSAIWGILA